MKKSTIAISIVAGLAVIATAGSYYTGTQAESQYQKFISQANQQLKQRGINAEIKPTKFERGLFSSKVASQIEFNDGVQSHVFNDEGELFHGPFPLNQLSKGNFVPALASYQHKISSAEKLPMFNDNQFIQATDIVSYGQEVKFDYEIAPMSYQDDYTNLISEKIKVNAKLDKNQNISYQIITPKAEFKDGTFALELLGVNYQNDQQPNATYPNLSSGNWKADIDNLNLSTNKEGKDIKLNLSQLQLTSAIQIKDQRAEETLKGNVNLAFNLNGNKADLGKISKNLTFNVDAQSLNKLAGYPFHSISETVLNQAFADLLQNQFQLKIQPLTISNEKGEVVNLNLDLSLNQFDYNNLRSLPEFFGVFKPSQLTAKLNMPALEQMMVQLEKLDPEQQNPQQKVQLVIAQLKSQLAQTPYVKLDGDNLESQIKIENGKIFINNNELTEQDIQTLFFIMIMLSGSIH